MFSFTNEEDMNKDAKARASERDSTRDDDRGRVSDLFERSVRSVFTHQITTNASGRGDHPRIHTQIYVGVSQCACF